MNNYNLVEHDNGPGIAATVVLNLLLDELVKKKLLSHGDVARLRQPGNVRVVDVVHR